MTAKETLAAWDRAVFAFRAFLIGLPYSEVRDLRASQELQRADPKMATPLWTSWGGPR